MNRISSVVFAVMLLCLLVNGCKEKQPAGVQQGKEKLSTVTFDPAKVLSKYTAGFVDVVAPETVSTAETIHSGGWAYDSQNMVPAARVVILADGKQLSVIPTMGLKREDVAKALKSDKLMNSGWDTSFSANDLGKGKHKLEFYALFNDGVFVPLEYHGKRYCEIKVK